MTSQTPDMQTVLKRLEKLETQNRRLLGGTVLAVASVGALVLMGQARPAHTIEASKFVVKDPDGRIRAELGMDSGSRPTFTIRDAAGLPLVSLAGGDQSFLTLTRTGGTDQVTLTNSKELFGLALYGRAGGPFNGIRVGLGVLKGLGPALSLYDETTGQERVSIDATST